MKTWEQLERDAFYGTIDLNGIEEPEKRAYFASLEQLYLSFRAGSVSRIDAERQKSALMEKYRKAISPEYEIFRKYQDAVKKAELIMSECEKAQDVVTIAEKACAIVSLLTGEDSFAPRQMRKIRQWEEEQA